ncbi:hypothetical protein BO71DRAFT_409592 [Aspergillus ellipticus CBS 707.79]|uniref:Uncharacterized protein n=1 Tax=Aspergillus ellipticus CBS 707.79 TaxID=1448320 RepID=A0A319E0Y9_9EURO|nr:hypothetical protein BO71DRAFT_409592 [Aspergillus ellipticus CBS 707.79]
MAPPTEDPPKVSNNHSTSEPKFNDTASTDTIPMTSPRYGPGLSPSCQNDEYVDEEPHGGNTRATDRTYIEPLEAVEPYGSMFFDLGCHSTDLHGFRKKNSREYQKETISTPVFQLIHKRFGVDSRQADKVQSSK